jgi:hypothetical protein
MFEHGLLLYAGLPKDQVINCIFDCVRYLLRIFQADFGDLSGLSISRQRNLRFLGRDIFDGLYILSIV